MAMVIVLKASFSTLYCSVAVLLGCNSTMEGADGPVVRRRREASFS